MNQPSIVSLRSLALVLLTAPLLPGPASADQFTWQGGGGNNNFTTPANWVGGVVPPPGATTDLVFGLSSGTAINNTGGTFALRRVTFGPDVLDFVVSGSPLSFQGEGAAIEFSSNNITFPIGRVLADVALGAPLQIAGNRAIILGGALSDPSNFGLQVTNTFLTDISGTFALGNVLTSPGASVSFSGSGTLAGLVEATGTSYINFSGDAASTRSLAAGAALRGPAGGVISFYGGTTRLEAGATVGPAEFFVDGGTLDGSGDLTLSQGPTNAFTFARGAILGAASQKLTVGAGRFFFNGSGTQQLGRELILSAGEIAFQAGTLELVNGGRLTISNAAAEVRSSTYAVTASGTGNVLRLVNGALLTKTSGSGTSVFTLGAPFDLGNGTLRVSAGTFRLTAGSNLPAGGTIDLLSTARLEFAGGAHALGASFFNNPGNVTLSAGNLALGGVGTLGAASGTLDLIGGTLTGVSADNLVGTAIRWEGTRIATTVSAPFVVPLTVNGPLQLQGTAAHVQDRRTLTLTQGGAWTGGDWEIGGGDTGNAAFVFLNGASSTIFRIQCDQAVRNGPAGPGTAAFVNNGGRLIKDTTAGTTTISTVFAQGGSGTVEVNSGRLLLSGGSGGGTVIGGLSAVAGATLEFGGGAFTLSASTWNGAGTFALTAGSAVLGGNVFGSGSGITELSGGTLTGNSSSPLAGTSIRWSGTRLATTLPTPFVPGFTVNGPLIVQGAATHVQDRRSLTLTQGGAWTGGDWEIGGGDASNLGAVFLNGASTTTFRIQCDQSVLNGPAGPGTAAFVNNGGRLIKETTAGTTTIGTLFSSNSSVEVNAGRLRLTGGTGAGNISGSVTVAAGAALEFGGGATAVGVNWFGGGNVSLTAGTAALTGSSSVFGPSAGTLDLLGGTLTSSSGYTLAATAIRWAGTRLATTVQAPFVVPFTASGPLLLEGSARHVQDRRSLFLNQGGAWTGGDWEIGSGDASNLAFVALNGDSSVAFRIQCDQGVFNGPSGSSIFQNNFSRLIKDTTTGTTTFATALGTGSGGTLEVNTGRVLLLGGTGAGAINGPIAVATGATLEFGGGTAALNSTTWSGAGRVVLSGGNLLVGAGATLGANSSLNFDLQDGDLNGGGDITLRGASIRLAGARLTTTLASPQVVSLFAFAPVQFAGPAPHVLNRRRLSAAAGGTWTGGDLILNGGSGTTALALTGNSSATLAVQCDQSILLGTDPNAAVVVNSGNRLLKNVTGGTTLIQPCLTNNGTVEVAAGTLALAASCSTNSGQLIARSGGTLRVNGAVTAITRERSVRWQDYLHGRRRLRGAHRNDIA